VSQVDSGSAIANRGVGASHVWQTVHDSVNEQSAARKGGIVMFRQWQDCRNALLARITACAASLILVLTVATVLCSARIASATLVIVTEQGPLTGVAAPGENQYLGIPYAAPRWEACAGCRHNLRRN